jgi:adenosylhomocysteine nucleosidase
METIGLIAAMNQESDALLRLIKGWKRSSLQQFKGVRFQSGERNCVLIITGWGRKRAGEATRVLLAESNPQVLISFGIAGAVHSDLQIGDVVISTKSCILENELPGQFLQLASLSEAAWNAAYDELRPYKAQLCVGTAITTHGSQVVLQKDQEFPNPILEMETAGIAQVAAEKGVPLVSIRSISDNPEAPIPLDLEAAMDEDDNLLVSKLVTMVFRDPKIIFQSGRMMNNSRIAADNAALALLAVLNERSPIINMMKANV